MNVDLARSRVVLVLYLRLCGLGEVTFYLRKVEVTHAIRNAFHAGQAFVIGFSAADMAVGERDFVRGIR